MKAKNFIKMAIEIKKLKIKYRIIRNMKSKNTPHNLVLIPEIEQNVESNIDETL